MKQRVDRSRALVIAAWTAVITGFIEGWVWVATRSNPLLNAAHKLSVDALWVAPLLNLICFLALGAVLMPLVGWADKKLPAGSTPALFGLFSFLGLYLAISAPQVIQNYGVAAVALGLAVSVSRFAAPQQERVTAWLRGRAWVVPAVIALAFLGARGWEYAGEAWRARSLPAPPQNAPNVLIVLLDTVRADRFAPHRAASLTPYLDRIGGRGVRFDNAWSTTSWSLPSQVSVLTGRYPHEHESDWPAARMAARFPSLAEVFARLGYATGAFSSNSAWTTPEYMGRGFLRFRVYIFEDLLRRTALGRKFDKLSEKVGLHSSGRGKPAAQLNREFAQFLEDYSGRPFFAYLCYMDVNREMHDSRLNQHKPMAQVVEDYDAALARLDQRVGEMLDDLARRGLLEKTIVIITSDHGESFGAGYEGDHDPAGHQSSLYREQSAVPLWVVYPPKVPAGRATLRTVSIRQLPATIAELLEWKDSPFIGESLSAGWRQPEPAASEQPHVFAELRHLDGQVIHESVIFGQWQYIRAPRNSRVIRQGEELFDNAADPKQKRNLASAPDSAVLVEGLRAKVAEFRSVGSAVAARRR
jgi:arylsulfatase A-like enzyme